MGAERESGVLASDAKAARQEGPASAKKETRAAGEPVGAGSGGGSAEVGGDDQESAVALVDIADPEGAALAATLENGGVELAGSAGAGGNVDEGTDFGAGVDAGIRHGCASERARMAGPRVVFAGGG